MLYTFIWLSAESLKPVISKTFTHVPTYCPYFFVAEGYKKRETPLGYRYILHVRKMKLNIPRYSLKQHDLCIHSFGCVTGHSNLPAATKNQTINITKSIISLHKEYIKLSILYVYVSADMHV